MRKLQTPGAAGALAALVLISWTAARSADVRQLSVTYDDRAFIVAADLVLRAPRAAVFRVLADYGHWVGLNRNIIESRVASSEGGRDRVRSVTRACVLFFCRDVRQTQTLAQRGEAELIAVTEPEKGNLSQGLVRWNLEAQGGETRIRLSARLTPDFWLPPLIGPWSIKSMLREQVLETAANLERLAAAADGE